MLHHVRSTITVPGSKNVGVLPELGIHDCAEHTPVRDTCVPQISLENQHDARHVRVEESPQLLAPSAGFDRLCEVIRSLAFRQPCAVIGAEANVAKRKRRDIVLDLGLDKLLDQSSLPGIDRQRHGWGFRAGELRCIIRANDMFNTNVTCFYGGWLVAFALMHTHVLWVECVEAHARCSVCLHPSNQLCHFADKARTSRGIDFLVP